MNYQSGVPVSVSVSGISQQSQPAMPTPGTVPAPVPQPMPPQFGSGSSGSSGAGQFGSGTVSGPAAQSGASGSTFALSNSAAIRGEIHRFESVHPNIYSIYDLIERIDDLALQNQIREHVISIEGYLYANQTLWCYSNCRISLSRISILFCVYSLRFQILRFLQVLKHTLIQRKLYCHILFCYRMHCLSCNCSIRSIIFKTCSEK
ncbi:hypothetical protein IRJ41_005475 [Triplophysa rosa]|uniref:Arf-GAP with GTPase, ANK repeat and PH domain-containing protein 3 n=1 Tax=Triplophysa rosa TaxID=992332 RepID=A0A9W7T9D8_TRIRA|nr:hypothetical protein IRJ41_005475 [Triplophysa rosa]